MAIMVSELAPGKWHYSLLLAVQQSDDLLVFKPIVEDLTGHETGTEAWIDGVLGVVAYLGLGHRENLP
ncbi:hypothetical protein [Variovorax atrisoli]|uniref:hypothetical protein n=1 Tax=Variovorax atrisoli TaxID=3394203 RepID=UPI0012FD8A3D|nr:hypothetical protein [Variovorax paradoxus]